MTTVMTGNLFGQIQKFSFANAVEQKISFENNKLPALNYLRISGGSYDMIKLVTN